MQAYIANEFNTKEPSICNGERKVSLLSGIGKTRQPYAKENETVRQLRINRFHKGGTLYIMFS